MAGRVIFHLDMNCFYASVEQAHDTSLKGKPIAIAGNAKERRGIIVTSSYEARAKGIYTTMNVGEARRKCPELLLLPPDFAKYRAASAAIFAILRSYTHLVEPVSIDEGYLDVTDRSKTQHPMELAQEIQQRILHELDLPCSIGIAPNKFLAKTASDMKKPMGITVLRKRQIAELLWPNEVIEMHGIGESTAKKLNSLQIFTIGDLANADERLLQRELGKNGARLKKRANGEDSREVDPNSIFDTKSVGNSTTLPRDETEYYILKETFEKLSRSVSERLKVKYLAGTTISIQIRNFEWQNQSRSKTVRNAIQNADEIFEIAWKLFLQNWDETPVRLIGITVSNVVDQAELTQQLNLFNFEQHIKDEPILELVDSIEKKFGKGAVKRGVRVKTRSYASKTSFSKDFLEDHKE
ncbi:DNA polymerase IV [Lysinibacillus sp. 2017]|uniref:DNA polymerase IV n=1 Tax=unclassified Lysinibacillus TaxID=2636778 RepID=UPI000D52A0A4|nr:MULTISPECIES: DNA polymerase IV [unclassified Lysinibacillus]AWE07599.1 DNA polymerase IV [Lysinibacillus sp. 2017]TGN36762.1 DNA polymerase IV [Lysinibacillus sp. S2017]